MPELPELEVIKDRLRVRLAGRRITGATLRQPATLKTVEPGLESLVGGHIKSVSRTGKFIVITTDTGLHLCVHLMLNGSLALGPSDRPMLHSHLFALHLEPGEDLRVLEAGTKHRAGIHLATDPKNVTWIAESGIDPQSPEFTLSRFRSALTRRNRTVKKFLTDQRTIAGIGNCYSDEILFEARLSPFQRTLELKPEQAIRLYAAVKKVLADAIIRLKSIDRLPDRRDRTFLKVHNRLDQPCQVCGSTVRRVSYEESTTYYCPGCQTEGRILADRRLSRLLK